MNCTTDRQDNIQRVALFDMDGSLFDYSGKLRADLERLRSPLEPEMPENLWEMEKQPHIGARMDLIKSQAGWWRNLERIEDGFKILNEAVRIGYKISVLTKGPKSHPVAWAEKLICCQENIRQDVDVTVTMDKGLCWGTFLYDDYPDYMTKWLEHRPRGLGIMPVTNLNKDYSHPQVVMWNGENLAEVVMAMGIAYSRLPKEPLILPWKQI